MKTALLTLSSLLTISALAQNQEADYKRLSTATKNAYSVPETKVTYKTEIKTTPSGSTAPNTSPSKKSAVSGNYNSYPAINVNQGRLQQQAEAAARQKARLTAFDAKMKKVDDLIANRGLKKSPEYQPQLFQAAMDGGLTAYEASRFFGNSPEEYSKMLAASANAANYKAPTYEEEKERRKKLELQLLEQEKLKKEEEYKQYKKVLTKADLQAQLILLEGMAEAKPNDDDLMQWFSMMVQAGVPTKDLGKATLKMSRSFYTAREKEINAGRGESAVRNAEYVTALSFLNGDSADHTPLLLYAAIQTNAYSLATTVLTTLAKEDAEIQQLAPALLEGMQLLSNSKTDAKKKEQVATQLFQYAQQLKAKEKVDFLDVALLTVAVTLHPKNEAYRQERMLLNGMLNCRKAQAEDEAFFFN